MAGLAMPPLSFRLPRFIQTPANLPDGERQVEEPADLRKGAQDA
jgi:hypothetical protein